MMKALRPSRRLPFDPVRHRPGDERRSHCGLAARPDANCMRSADAAAAQQWGDFWTGALSGKASEKPRDRRFASPEWQDDAYYRAIRDAYLLASKQLRDVVRSATATTAASNAMVALPARPISERRRADQFRRDQPRRGRADQGDQRRQPRPGLRQPARGHRQRQGHRPAPHRSRCLREGQDHRRDAGRGGVRERAVPADPVRPDDRQGRGRAAALRAAAGEPLLHDRPGAAAEPGQMAGRRGPHRVRHLLGQPDRGASRTRASSDYVLDGIVEAIEQVRQADRRDARPVLLLPRRHAGRDRAGLAGGQGARRRGQFGDPDRHRWSISPTCATGRPSSTKAISPRSTIISRRRAISTASSCSGCSRRCAPTT